MKSEKQCLVKLEETVNSLNALCEKLSDDAPPTPEQADEMRNHIAFLWAMAWVMDQEAEFAGFIRQMKLAQIAQRLGKTGASVQEKPS